ncbi:hypothetical protein Thiowin_01096 [Thiorhodovibrio winogradskyi]|uniref:Uncharacterized protein n=1 Tax=Thiorhodovibrio winogradskyi TaxID=77007 RepID=A0ABZ0S6M4_9GAMM
MTSTTAGKRWLPLAVPGGIDLDFALGWELEIELARFGGNGALVLAHQSKGQRRQAESLITA